MSSIPLFPLPDGLPEDDVRAVAHAIALLWTWRPRTTVFELVRALGFKSAVNGKGFSQEQVKAAVAALRERGWAHEHVARSGFYHLEEPHRTRLYKEVLERYPLAQLKEGLARQAGFRAEEARYYWPIYDSAATIALFRLELFGGADTDLLGRWREAIGRRFEWSAILHEAVMDADFDAELFERTDPEWRWDIAYIAADVVCNIWRTDYLPVFRWALEQARTRREEMPEYLRLQLAQAELLSGNGEQAIALLHGDTSGSAEAIRAGLLIQDGQWAQGSAAFEAALKKRQAEVNAKKRVFPTSLAWLYPMALLAQGTPKTVEQAHKFCVGESGSRNPPPMGGWGMWAYATAVRLGDTAPDKHALDTGRQALARPSIDTLWTLLLRAWLAAEHPLPSQGKARSLHDEAVIVLKQTLHDCGFLWLEQLAMAAEAVLGGHGASIPFFAGGGEESWRTVLASLVALAGEGGSTGDKEGSRGETRLLWQLTLGKRGSLLGIEPLEQVRGPRGWSKPKAVTLAKLAGNQGLPPHDAKIARAIHRDRHHARRYSLDRAAAIMALVGHPAVILAEQPQTIVDVVEATPQLETVKVAGKDGERFQLRVTPAPHPDPASTEEWRYFMGEAERREAEALRYIHVEQESPQRVRVIRLTPAQRRAAQLISGRFSVPANGQDELQAALRALAGHFNVHTDEAVAARQQPAETRLRAELCPAGEGLVLRLVAAPLGPQGPRLMPGRGRARVMAAIGGESVGTERDLAAEQRHLDAVLEMLEFLAPPAPADTACEWPVEDAELALAMVEALPTIAAVSAVDWPRGKAVRVRTVDVAQVQITVTTERNWLRVEGRTTLDEGRVFELQALLAAASAKSRFVALGDGAYLALTKSLREKLQALAAVADAGKDGLRAPALAAPWLDEALAGAQVEFDRGFAERMARLRNARESAPTPPRALQAELRAYQEDGYAWAMRLAEAGFGACLADDMGLGKTLQALAVLVARATGGPALVVAPTSVCGNWQAEAARFAPSLRTSIYGEGDRAATLAELGPGDLLIVSYTLMQQEGESFATRQWHTLVADEAQAVKNATTKRSQALYDLPADFHLALSGTPVENRLAELWSIMHFCNPGLLGTPSRFNERFAAPIERGRDRDAQRTLRRLVAPFILRRTKAQVLDDLPPRTELVLSVTADADEAAHYEALRRNLVSDAEALVNAEKQAGQTRLHILAQIMKLRRAACDPRLVTPQLGYVGAKVRAFAELAAELAANGHKALVFSQFVDFLALLREPLDQAGIAYQYLDGATPPAERTRRVTAFQAGEGDLFLISLKAGGFGLNLTAADYVVITDPWWNPAAEDQAMGRAHRIGQQRPVTVYRLVAKGTLEERIIELHHDKRALAEGVLAEGEDTAALPSTEELIALLRG